MEKVAGSGVSKVVITHGTDTLAYTGTALSLFFGQSKDARICLTGSFYSLEDPRTDAPLNLLTALRCVSSGKIPPGVYVAFPANEKNKVAMLRHAHTIKPMSFDGIAFHGAFGEYVATFEPKSGIQMARQAASEPDLGLPSLADQSAGQPRPSRRCCFKGCIPPGISRHERWYCLKSFGRRTRQSNTASLDFTARNCCIWQ